MRLIMDEFDKKHMLSKLAEVVENKRWSSSMRQSEIQSIVNFGSDDKDFLIDAAAVSGSVSRYLEAQWLSDFDIALACVKKNPGQIVDFSPKIQDRDEIVEAATNKHPFIYCLLNERHRARREIFEKTLEHSQVNIKNFLMAPMEFRDDIAVINTYMAKDPIQTYENMPEEYKMDKGYLTKYIVAKFSTGDFKDFGAGVEYIKKLDMSDYDKKFLIATSIVSSEGYISKEKFAMLGEDLYENREFWSVVVDNINPNNRFRNNFGDFYWSMPEFLVKEIEIGVNHLHKQNDTGELGGYFQPLDIKYAKEVVKLGLSLEKQGIDINPGDNVFIVKQANDLRKELESRLPKIEDLINVKNLSGDNLNTDAIPMKSTLNKKSGRLKI